MANDNNNNNNTEKFDKFSDPLLLFTQWFEEAKSCRDIIEPTAMTLASVCANGQPSARIVLLKAYDQRGLVFFTNMESRKSLELAANPKAALCFYWMNLKRQIRIEGAVERISDAEADAYFATRPRESQLGAVASKQSRPLNSTAELFQAVKAVEAEYQGKTVPRPANWSGWRLSANLFEFWQQGDFRLHERKLYKLSEGIWTESMLYP